MSCSFVNIQVKVKWDPHVTKYNLTPTTVGSSGIDLRSTKKVVLSPLSRKVVPTGIFLEIPEGYEAQIRSRSGLALNNGVIVLNSPGTIDYDYRNEIGVILHNTHKKESFIVSIGDRIAQMVFAPVIIPTFEEVEELSGTERGQGGFGSTGV